MVPGLFRVGILVTDASAGGVGGAVLLDLDARDLQLIDAGQPAPRPFCGAPHTAHSTPPALRATGINTKNDVRGRGRGSGADGWELGRGEAVYTRAYMQAHTYFLCPTCATHQTSASNKRTGSDICSGHTACTSRAAQHHAHDLRGSTHVPLQCCVPFYCATTSMHAQLAACITGVRAALQRQTRRMHKEQPGKSRAHVPGPRGRAACFFFAARAPTSLRVCGLPGPSYVSFSPGVSGRPEMAITGATCRHGREGGRGCAGA